MTPLPPGRWTTFAETGAEMHRSAKTISNLVYKHELPRIISRVGKHPRRRVLLGEKAREMLRKLCLGVETM
jgi:hypothetical protein